VSAQGAGGLGRWRVELAGSSLLVWVAPCTALTLHRSKPQALIAMSPYVHSHTLSQPP
jgi:hypothetical protein